MRRIGIAASIAAILAGTLPGLALAQSLRPAYAADGASQSTPSVPTRRVVHVRKLTSTIAPKSTPSRAAAAPQSDGAVTAQSYAAPAASPPAVKSRPA